MSDADLDQAYFEYAMAHAEWERMPKGHPKLAAQQAKRDELWQSYVSKGGVLPPLIKHEAATPLFDELAPGTDGARVSELQKLLGMPEHVQTGAFGPTTMRLVQNCQARHNLPQTGIVDSKTWSILNMKVPFGKDDAAPLRPRDIATGTQLEFRLRDRDCSKMMALDAVPQRTYCNTFNLALMALLVYADKRTENPDGSTRSEQVPLDDLHKHINTKGGDFEPVKSGSAQWRPIVRLTEPGHQYQTVKLDAQDHTYKADDIKKKTVYIDTQARLWMGRSHSIIAFRGTAEMPHDVITDLSAAKIKWPYGPGYAPMGFLYGFLNIEKDLRAALQKLPKNQPIFITGHSLGAALACLAACYVRSQFPSHPVYLYSFAQPRATDVEMASHYFLDPLLVHYRFKNPVDPIPMVPSRRLAHDLVALLGDNPDTLPPKMLNAMGVNVFYNKLVRAYDKTMGNKERDYFTEKQLKELEDTVANYRKMMAQIALQQSQGEVLSFDKLAVVLAPPEMDSRHFGVKCLMTRRSKHPTIEQDVDRSLETPQDIDADDLVRLLQATTAEAGEVAKWVWATLLVEALTGQNALENKRGVQLRIDPRAHKMTSYIAYVLFEFERHPGYTRKVLDAELPFTTGALEESEPMRFKAHYFNNNRFWGDRAEDKDIKIQDGKIVLWGDAPNAAKKEPVYLW